MSAVASNVGDQVELGQFDPIVDGQRESHIPNENEIVRSVRDFGLFHIYVAVEQVIGVQGVREVVSIRGDVVERKRKDNNKKAIYDSSSNKTVEMKHLMKHKTSCPMIVIRKNMVPCDGYSPFYLYFFDFLL